LFPIFQALFPSAAPHEVLRCRPGIVANSQARNAQSAKTPDQRCTACALHRVRGTLFHIYHTTCSTLPEPAERMIASVAATPWIA
jgi:hypothetical protein